MNAQNTNTAVKATRENIEFIKKEIAKQWGKGSAWSRGVTAYADMILENIADAAQWYSAQGQEFPDISENIALNGATSWEQWAYGGCGLVYDYAIAETLCSPSELKRRKGGELQPNQFDTWLDLEARAARQAWRRITRIINQMSK